MKKTDYSKIAATYDNNPVRHLSEPDPDLVEYINANSAVMHNVLDLACGTGNYLRFHIDYFKSTRIHWCGADSSKDMLEVAKTKLPEVDLRNEDVVHLSFNSEMFDYIVNNVAFHHFENKEKSLDEISRIMKVRGVLKIRDLSPFHMEGSWVYRYFPCTYLEDLNRFWHPRLLFYELQKRKFKVRIDINCNLEELELKNLLVEAERRDASQFVIISDRDYQDGIDRMKYDLAKDHDKTIDNEFCLMNCIAIKL